MAADAAAPPRAADAFPVEPEPTGPKIAIDFPPADARTEQTRLRVRGRVVAAQGGTLSLNGANVPLDASGAWSVPVALQPGLNALEFELALASERVRVVRNVRSETELHYPTALAVDAANNLGYVLDRDTLQSFDLETGARSLISGPTRGQGPALLGTALTVDAANHRVLVGGAGAALLAVDTATGDRRVLVSESSSIGVRSLVLAPDGRVLISSESQTWFDPRNATTTPLDPIPSIQLTYEGPLAGPAPSVATKLNLIAWRDGPEHAYVVASGVGLGLFSANFTTGESALVARNSRGAGPELKSVMALALDDSGSAAYFTDSERHILRVDLQSGDRTLISGVERGAGPLLRSPQIGGLAFDAKHQRLLATSGNDVVAVDLVSGDRTPLASNRVDASDPDGVTGPWLTEDGNHAVVMAEPRGSLSAIDLRSGKRRAIASFIPGGPLALDTAAMPQRVLMRYEDQLSLYAVSFRDGARTLISGEGRGAGTAFVDPRSVAFDSRLDALHAYMLDWRDSLQPEALVRVDLTNGDRTIISDATTGSGPNAQLQKLVLDFANKRALTFSGGAYLGLLAIDLQTGERRELARVDTGMLDYQLALDADANRALVASSAQGLAGIDLQSGARSILSSATVGAGPAIDALRGLVAVPRRQLALLICNDRLLAVDLTNGERAIIL